MRNVTDDFKIDLKTYGRQLDAKIKINNADFDSDNLNYIKPSFYTSLFKTIMHQVEIDSKVYMPQKTKISINIGVKLNEKNYTYLDLGTYYVKTCEKQEDTNSYRIMAYTKMKDSMIDYDLNITERITLREYLIRICERLGWNTNNIPATFINSEKLVDPYLHVGIKYTFREALDEIATLSCSFLLFKNDEFYLSYITDTNENIDESYLDEDNITIGEKYFINSLVFSRVEGSDNIFRKNQNSIDDNGLHEYKISDCQLLSTNDRADYIDEMFNYLKTLEFYIFDIQSKGILFLEACDMFNLVLKGIAYKVVLLNNEINIEDGLTENLYFDEPSETETEYKYADSTDKKLNETYMIVDKQNQKIESVISNVTNQNQKIAKVTQTIDELNSKIGDIADITTSKESLNGIVSFEKVNQSEPIRVEIHPTGENISYLYPNTNLFPSKNLYLKVRTLRFMNITTNDFVDYELPTDLLYYDTDNYDEFILDYDAQSCVVNKKVGYNTDGTTYVLDKPTTIEYEYPKILLSDGDYTITLLGYNNAYMFVRLMAQNIYTTQFATKAEVNSEISQTANEINLSVNKKLERYDTSEQVNSKIQQKADSITSIVSKTYETKSNVSNTYATKAQLTTAKSEIKQTIDGISSEVSKKVGSNEIISKINQSAEAVGIKADKIELSANDVLNLLAGNTINLSSKNIAISSDNFKVDKNGNVICFNIDIKSGKILLKGGTTEEPMFSIEDPNNEDMRALITPSSIQCGDSGTDGYFVVSRGILNVGRPGNGGTIQLTQGSSRENSKFYMSVGDAYVVQGNMHASTFLYDSLESMKKNITPFEENALELIKAIDIYEYNFKCENDNIKKHIGFVIGDKYNYSQKVTGKDNTGVDNYAYTSLCVKAIQEQQQQIEQLKAEIQKLKKESE